MTYDRTAILKAAWAIVRGADVARYGLRLILRNALRCAWSDAKRAVAEARRQAEALARAARPRTEAERIAEEILCLECKDRLSPSDWQTLASLRTALRIAQDRDTAPRSPLAA